MLLVFLFVSDRSSFSCVAGRVFLFALSVSSSALNRVGFQFVLPASSFLVRSSRPVPTRLFSCCCFLVRSVAAAGLALVSARAPVRISIPALNSPAGLFARSSVLALVSSSSFLIPVPCSNTRLANILFLGAPRFGPASRAHHR
jgi:hypothetical protein